MLKCIEYLSNRDVEQEIPLSELHSFLLRGRTAGAAYKGAVDTALEFLALFGIVEMNREGGTLSIGGKNAIMALRSLRECLKADVRLVSDWDRLGVHEDHIIADEVIGSGVDLVYWLESVRKKQSKAVPVKTGHVSKAIIKAKSQDGLDLFLMQRSPDSGRYSLIGGIRRKMEESPKLTMQREIKEELRDNKFRFGENAHVELAGEVPAEFVSPKYGALTRWNCSYFNVRFTGMDLRLHPETCWVSKDEFERGWLRTGEPVLQLPMDARQKLATLMDQAPLSVTEPVDVRVDDERRFPGLSASWIERLCVPCIQRRAYRVSPVALLDCVVDRLQIFIKALEPKNGDPGLRVKDENEFQHVLFALLRLFFEDVRPEEPTPSTAGASAKMDFLLKKEHIVVETKMMRKSLKTRELGDQLITDSRRYHEHPDCQTLYCLIYDPAARLLNPRGVERDLSSTKEKVHVKVRVVPGT
jgi:hypothetical protein